MIYTMLLYGATGYSGRLIAARAHEVWNKHATKPYRLILAGRDGPEVAKLAAELKMSYRVFALDQRDYAVRNLSGVHVVINAAGPFALTGERLAKAALDAGCHYVDINGEVDVYCKLDDLGRYAVREGLRLVCGAGHTATVSDLMLEAALATLRPPDASGLPDVLGGSRQLGAVRIAMSHVPEISRGSMQTVLRSLREQVTVVRQGEVTDGRGGGSAEQLVLWHEPVGKLERTFEFGKLEGDDETVAVRRIASAANLVDTLTARLTLMRNRIAARCIESYVETDTVRRLAYQAGVLLAPFMALPFTRPLVRAQVGLLPEGPMPTERRKQRHVVLLDIEDRFGKRVIDWRCVTPSAYTLTAQLAIAVAEATANARISAEESKSGWLTPADVLVSDLRLRIPQGPTSEDIVAWMYSPDGPLSSCSLERR